MASERYELMPESQILRAHYSLGYHSTAGATVSNQRKDT